MILSDYTISEIKRKILRMVTILSAIWFFPVMVVGSYTLYQFGYQHDMFFFSITYPLYIFILIFRKKLSPTFQGIIITGIFTIYGMIDLLLFGLAGMFELPYCIAVFIATVIINKKAGIGTFIFCFLTFFAVMSLHFTDYISFSIDTNSYFTEKSTWVAYFMLSTHAIIIICYSAFLLLTLLKKHILELNQKSVSLQKELDENKIIRAKLQQNEQKYYDLFELAGDAIIILNHFKIVECNQAAVSLFESESKEQLLDKTLIDLSPYSQPDGNDSFSKATKYFERKKLLQFYWQIKTFKHKNIDTEITFNDILIEGTNYTQVVIKNISTIKKTVTQLKTSKKQLQLIFENSPSYLILLDENGHIIKSNKHFKSLAKKDKACLLQQSRVQKCILAINDPKSCPNSPSCDTCNLKQIVYNTSKYNQTVHNEEVQIMLEEGDKTTLHTLIISSEKIQDEGIIVHLVTLNDITDYKNAEQALRESEEKFRDFANSVTDIYFAMDKDLRYIFWNKACERALGLKYEDVIGKSYYDFEFNTGYEWIAEKYKSIMKTSNAESFSASYQTGGTTLHFKVNAYPTQNGILVFLQDETQRKLAEKALFENQEKFKCIAENIPGIVYQFNIKKDGSSYFSYISTNKLSDLGLPEDTESREWQEMSFIHPEDQNSFWLSIRLAIESKTHWNYEGRILTINNEVKWFRATSTLNEINEELSFYGVMLDITPLKQSEFNLRKNEEQLNALLNATQESAFLCKINGEVIVANQIGAQRVGHIPDTLTGKSIYQFFPSDIASQRKKNGDEVIKTNKPVRFKDNRDGIYYDTTIYPVFNHERKIRAFAIYSKNITNEYIVHKRLEQSEARFKKLIRFAPDAIYLHNSEGKIVETNIKASKYLGYSQEEIKKMTVMDIDIHYPTLEEVVQELSRLEFLESMISYGRHKRKDGSSFPVEINNSLIQTVPQKLYLASVRDISSQMKAQKKLEAAEQKYRGLVETSINLIWQCDLQGRFTYLNPAWELTHGYKLDEMLGKPFRNFQATEAYERDLKVFQKRIQTKKSGKRVREHETTHIHKSGKEINLVFNSSPTYNDQGDITGMQGTAYDITEKKQVQKHILNTTIETEEKERKRIAQELHDGLGPILSTIKLYIETYITSKDNTFKEKIKPQMLQGINDALEQVSAISNNLSPHVLDDFGLKIALERFIHKLHSISKIDFQLNIKSYANAEKTIEVCLYRVIIELINNTIKHSKATKATISLNYSIDNVILIFTNNGELFDYEKLKAEGKGIGLFSMQNRVESFNGSFVFDNSELVKYTITIPFKSTNYGNSHSINTKNSYC